MRIILLITLLFSSLFAYKDAFYLGAYTGAFEGKSDYHELDIDDIESTDRHLRGVRLGWNRNSLSGFYFKNRIEFNYDQRKYLISDHLQDGWHFGVSYAWGYNLDWLLTQEITPYISLGAGAGKLDKLLGNGTDMSLGLGLALSFRLVEFTVEIKREFWQLDGFRFPFGAPFQGDATTIDHAAAGINIKF